MFFLHKFDPTLYNPDCSDYKFGFGNIKMLTLIRKKIFVYIISEECHNTVYTPKYTHLLYKICNYEYRIMNTILHERKS